MSKLQLPLSNEIVKCRYWRNGRGPKSRPFFTLSHDDTGCLLLLLVFLAQNSAKKSLDELIVDSSTGETWYLLFQRVHVRWGFGQWLTRASYLIGFSLRNLLRINTVSIEHNFSEVFDYTMAWLLRTIAKEPQQIVRMTVMYPTRQEQWKFLFLKLAD